MNYAELRVIRSLIAAGVLLFASTMLWAIAEAATSEHNMIFLMEAIRNVRDVDVFGSTTVWLAERAIRTISFIYQGWAAAFIVIAVLMGVVAARRPSGRNVVLLVMLVILGKSPMMVETATRLTVDVMSGAGQYDFAMMKSEGKESGSINRGMIARDLDDMFKAPTESGARNMAVAILGWFVSFLREWGYLALSFAIGVTLLLKVVRRERFASRLSSGD